MHDDCLRCSVTQRKVPVFLLQDLNSSIVSRTIVILSASKEYRFGHQSGEKRPSKIANCIIKLQYNSKFCFHQGNERENDSSRAYKTMYLLWQQNCLFFLTCFFALPVSEVKGSLPVIPAVIEKHRTIWFQHPLMGGCGGTDFYSFF